MAKKLEMHEILHTNSYKKYSDFWNLNCISGSESARTTEFGLKIILFWEFYQVEHDVLLGIEIM